MERMKKIVITKEAMRVLHLACTEAPMNLETSRPVHEGWEIDIDIANLRSLNNCAECMQCSISDAIVKLGLEYLSNRGSTN